MWLLDANVDVHLAPIFKQRGIPCDTVAHHGWKALSNGELVARAFAEGFRCLLTRDQLFGESASQALKSFPQFAVVVITLPLTQKGRIRHDRRRPYVCVTRGRTVG
jgi:predicted nuclease of predicted toxin-antitoxin system